jgi:hypothetical protein
MHSMKAFTDEAGSHTVCPVSELDDGFSAPSSSEPSLANSHTWRLDRRRRYSGRIAVSSLSSRARRICRSGAGDRPCPLHAGIINPETRGWQPPAPVAEPRPIDVPLTFEDLMTPIDQPSPIQERYSATTPIRALQAEQERVAGLVMPAMESLAANQLEELQRSIAELKPQPTAQPQPTTGAPQGSAEPRAAGSLASSREAMPEQLPKAAPNAGANAADPAERERHWILQPK